MGSLSHLCRWQSKAESSTGHGCRRICPQPDPVWCDVRVCGIVLWKRFHNIPRVPPDPTIYDVAEAAGVGIATVSRVMNGESKVRPSTRASVLSAIKELGYKPNRAARRLAGRIGNRPRVAVLLPFFTASFYFSISRAIARGLAAEDIDLVLHDVPNRDAKNRILERLLAERGAEAIILVSIGVGAERQQQLERLGIPVVSVDRHLHGVPSVCVDNQAGGRMAVDHLLACGCQKIGLIGGPRKALALVQRERAFHERLGDDAPKERAASVEAEAGRLATGELLDHHPDLDGLVCVNDLLAVGALKELRQRGRRVPEDVQVIGFDDQPMIDVIDLTTIRQPVSRMGNWAVSAITRLMKDGGDLPSEHVALELIPRSTTRPQP